MSKNVVVVESPSKAKTINKYLGPDFTVLASVGHVRDLPAQNGSVRPEGDFSMSWKLGERGKKSMDAIGRELERATTLYLATDPDREGEAISWHVSEVLKEEGALSGKKVHRIVFNEINKKAILDAMQKPREINQSLVDAYLARRALDYLVGFTLSPLLWRKLPGARSAGRVQSVALRLIVEREEEIESFESREYWTIHGDFETTTDDGKRKVHARLTYYNGQKLNKLDIGTESTAKSYVEVLLDQTYSVSLVEKKQVKRQPAPPFITSTLQQEASRKLGFSTSKTMTLAQRLYEGIPINKEVVGLITYMRTDSVALSTEAVSDVRSFIGKEYGNDYLPKGPREFKKKVKNAQEAHEAIRPTSITYTPEQMASYLENDLLRLYTLIWKRTLASQMENALFDQVAVDISSSKGDHVFRANGSTLVFDGFLRLYQEGTDEGPALDTEENLLPPLKTQEPLGLTNLDPAQHFTQPPPRYTEASLVKRLEELGIGRPSTYAPLVQVLQDRDYVRLEKRQFIPEDSGRLVTSFLKHFFKKYVEYDFTAQVEEILDNVSEGKHPWKSFLSDFWGKFDSTVQEASSLRIAEVIDLLEEDLKIRLFEGKEKEERICPSCEIGIRGLRLGKYGAFIGCSRYPDCKYTQPLSAAIKGEEKISSFEPTILGNDDGHAVSLRKGPYGFYLQWDALLSSAPSEQLEVKTEEGEIDKSGGVKKLKKKPKKTKVAPPKRVALPAHIDPESATLELALKLKRIPFSVGIYEPVNEPIIVATGRFGPYLKCGELLVSIPKAIPNYWEIGFNQACDLIRQKKEGKRVKVASSSLKKNDTKPRRSQGASLKKSAQAPTPTRRTVVKKVSKKISK